MRHCVPFMLCLALLSMPAAADDAILLADRDNTLYESPVGAFSNGSGINTFVGTTARGQIRRAVIAFDVVSVIPAGSTVHAVQLDLSVSRTRVGDRPVSLHRLLAPWGEGASDAGGQEGIGALAEEGDATWVHRFFDTERWTTPGGDFVQTPSATIDVGFPRRYVWGSTDAMVADVQRWIDDPAANHGWILIGDESRTTTAKRLDSRENPVPQRVPRMFVAFTPPFRFARFDPAAATASFALEGGDRFAFAARFELDPQSDGIDPETEEVRVSFGTAAVRLPAGSFDCEPDGCRYVGTDPAIVQAAIADGWLVLRVRGVELDGSSNPIRVFVSIGNDQGETGVSLAGSLSLPNNVAE